MNIPITAGQWKRRMRGIFRAVPSEPRPAANTTAASSNSNSSPPQGPYTGDSNPVDPPSNDPPNFGLPGPSLGGRYRLLHLIDRGGQGSVFQAFDSLLRRHVAIKVPGEKKWWPMRALAQIECQHVVRTLEVFEDQGLYYHIMDYIDGQTLASYVAEHGAISWRRAAQIGIQLCDALIALHEHNPPGRRRCIAHLDIKPGNILRLKHSEGYEDFVKLIDLGSARRTIRKTNPDIYPLSAQSTDDEAGPNTPPYRAPEQDPFAARYSDNVPTVEDHRTDIFQVGEVLYELVTGRAPFPDNSEERARLYTDGWVTPPSRRVPNGSAPALFDRVLLTALEKWPKHRFQTAREFRRVLQELLRRTEHSRPFAVWQQRCHWILLVCLTVASALTGAKLFNQISGEGFDEPTTTAALYISQE